MIHVIKTPASVLLWDGDGRELNNPDVALAFDPDVDGEVGRQLATLTFSLPMGAFGDYEVVIDVPLQAILAWAELIKAAS